MKGLAVSPLSDGTRHKKQENLTTDNTDVTDEEICDPSFIHLFIRVIRCAKTGALNLLNERNQPCNRLNDM